MQIRTWEEAQQIINKCFEYKCDFCGKTSKYKSDIESCEELCKAAHCSKEKIRYKFTYSERGLKGIIKNCDCDCDCNLEEISFRKVQSFSEISEIQTALEKIFEILKDIK